MSIDYYAELDGKSAAYEERINADMLCARCVNGTVFRRRRMLNLAVYCSVIREFVPSDIVECTGFANTKAMSLFQMSQIAEVIDKRPPGVNDGSYA